MSFGKKKLVTSALPYVHGIPHLGNLSGSILPADIYHRFLDVRGLENYYFCGSDVHGTPSALAAMEEGEEPKEFTQKQHRKIKSVLEEFNIDFTHYSQTHTSYNREQTQKMFKQLYRNGYIAEKTQNLPYCRNDER
ncbi:MAG: class I tRNA ligase family protein, partial [Candidatus Nanohaloarchaeota archaeon QJJ-9]|nr:class I tRNA ligase family protein [Candidatus Nanohaloarchaeota archaeon QJJ-9]